MTKLERAIADLREMTIGGNIKSRIEIKLSGKRQVCPSLAGEIAPQGQQIDRPPTPGYASAGGRHRNNYARGEFTSFVICLWKAGLKKKPVQKIHVFLFWYDYRPT